MKTRKRRIANKKQLALDDLPDFLKKMLVNGFTADVLLLKKGKIKAHLVFVPKPEPKIDEKDVVRIPCVVVPSSPFHKTGS